MGRRKINIAKIEDRQKRHVSFSKRRMGLFKKASELSTLCDAQVAIVVYSASGKPYICSSPSSAETVFHRYLATDDSSSSSTNKPQSSDSAISNLVLLSNLATQIEDDEGHVVPEEKRTQLVETGKGKGINVEAIDDFDELEQLQKLLNKKREMLLAQAKQSLDEPSASGADSDEFDIDDEETMERSAVPLLPWSYNKEDPL